VPDFNGDEAKKILLKNKIEMANSKKLRFSKPPNLNIFLSKILAIGAGFIGMN
jgi:hypothetical protein